VATGRRAARLRSGAAALAALLLLIGPGPGAAADPATSAAQALLARYHEDPARIDRARDLLEAALAQRGPTLDPLILLARVCFLYGDLRARGRDEQLATYARGRTAGKQAVDLAPDSDQARLWHAVNTGRWAQTRGVLRALLTLGTVREEAEAVIRLNPRSVEGHALVGSLYFEVPSVLGGDHARAEAHFRKALELDPARTGVRVALARLHLAAGRHAHARRELERVLAEPSPSDGPYWTLADAPRARALLDTLDRPP
jgi:tetratricopeptide (TPR) repeat protein